MPEDEAETGLSSVIDQEDAELPQELPGFDRSESLFQLDHHNSTVPPPQRQVQESESDQDSEDEDL